MGRISRNCSLIFLVLGSIPSFAASGWTDSPLGKAKFGEPWNGAAVTPEALEGKVVLVKSWAEW